MNMTVMLLDNEIYGLTKKQTSPTSRLGTHTNTHPEGSMLPPLNPLSTTLGISNVSFVAQTVDWNPAHVYATLQAAYEHPGFSFVRILQRCPVMNKDCFDTAVVDPEETLLLTHENGIPLDDQMRKIYKNSKEHDPSDINKASEVSQIQNCYPIGLLFQDKNRVRYDEYGAHNLTYPADRKFEILSREFDRYAV